MNLLKAITSYFKPSEAQRLQSVNRKQAILEVMAGKEEPMAAYEIGQEIFPDCPTEFSGDKVHRRLTELMASRMVVPEGKRKHPVTRKPVRLYRRVEAVA